MNTKHFQNHILKKQVIFNNIKKIQKKSALRQKDDNQNNLSSTGFNWASSSVLQDWYMTRSKLKYKDIKSMLIQTKEKINQCR